MTKSTQAPALRVGLWIAQLLVGVPFVMIGFMKLTTPIPELAKMMPWAGQLPVLFVRSIGLVDVAGGVGIVLPALTRGKKRPGNCQAVLR